jgi:hypothetical protein
VADLKLTEMSLSAEERQVLEGWARRRKTSQALAVRARIVLACADGGSNTEVAAALGGVTGDSCQVAVAVPGGPAGGPGGWAGLERRRGSPTRRSRW